MDAIEAIKWWQCTTAEPTGPSPMCRAALPRAAHLLTHPLAAAYTPATLACASQPLLPWLALAFL